MPKNNITIDMNNPIMLIGDIPAIVQRASDERGTDRMYNGSSRRCNIPAVNGRKMKIKPNVSDKN